MWPAFFSSDAANPDTYPRVATCVGVAVNSLPAMASGRLDAALMWVTDLLLSRPQLPLLLVVICLFQDLPGAVLGAEGGIFAMIVVVIGGLRCALDVSVQAQVTQPVCAEAAPPLAENGDGHWARCHFRGESGMGSLSFVRSDDII